MPLFSPTSYRCKKRPFPPLAWGALLLAPLQGAETAGVQVHPPLLGYIFDAGTNALHPVSGVPGAALVEAGLPLGEALRGAYIHSSTRSSARLAIAVTKEGRLARVTWSDHSPAVTLTPLDTLLDTVTQASLSGPFAVLTDGATVEVWSGLDGHPWRSASFTAGGGVTAVAVSRQGKAAAATGQGQILLLGDGLPAVWASGGRWTALAFAGEDLLAAGESELVRISVASGFPVRMSAGALSEAPVGLAASQDGVSVAVLWEGQAAVLRLGETLSEDFPRFPCPCSASYLALLEGNLVLQVGPGLVLDADSVPPRLVPLPGAHTPPPTTPTGATALPAGVTAQ